MPVDGAAAEKQRTPTTKSRTNIAPVRACPLKEFMGSSFLIAILGPRTVGWTAARVAGLRCWWTQKGSLGGLEMMERGGGGGSGGKGRELGGWLRRRGARDCGPPPRMAS